MWMPAFEMCFVVHWIVLDGNGLFANETQHRGGCMMGFIVFYCKCSRFEFSFASYEWTFLQIDWELPQRSFVQSSQFDQVIVSIGIVR